MTNTIDRDELLSKLTDLSNAAAKVLDNAQSKKYEINDAVNWADLSASASFVIEEDGHEHYQVDISEAHPCADRFRDFVRDNLHERGWEDVWILTEW